MTQMKALCRFSTVLVRAASLALNDPAIRALFPPRIFGQALFEPVADPLA
ncbi:hypothetical protein [Streptomyces sp. NPDC003006]